MSELPQETTDKVLQLLSPGQVLEYLDYRVETIQETERAARCFCPVHKEQVFRTFSFDFESARGKCSYTPCPAHKPVNLIELVALVHDVTVEDALVELVRHFKLRVSLPGEEALPESPMEMAQEAIEAGDFEESFAKFQEVLNEEPENLEALEGLARSCAETGKADDLGRTLKALAGIYLASDQPDRAAESLKKHLGASPNDVEARLRYAECLHRLGREEDTLAEMFIIGQTFETDKEWDKALEIYRRIQASHPESAETEAAIERLLVNSGRTGEAIEAIQKRAENLAAEGKTDDALACYRDILDLAPERDDVRQQQIDLIFSRENAADSILPECLELVDGFADGANSPGALLALEKLQQRFSDDLGLLERLHGALHAQGRDTDADEMAFDLANNCLESEDYENAKRWVETLVEHGGAGLSAALSLKAHICQTMGNTAETVATLLRAVELQEENGQHEEAQSFYASILEIDPKNLDVHQRRLQALTQQGQTEALAPALEQALDALTAADDPNRAIDFLSDLLAQSDAEPFARHKGDLLLAHARCLEAMGQESEAQHEMRQAANVFLDNGNPERGVGIFEDIIASDPHDVEAIEKLADTRLALGQQDEALAAYRLLADLYGEQGSHDAQLDLLLKMSTIVPEDPEILHQVLGLYDQLGNTRDARELRAAMARLHYDNGDYDEALDLCTRVLKGEPANVSALDTAVHVHAATGNLDQLRRDGLRLLKLHMDSDSVEGAGRIMEMLGSHFPNDAEIQSLEVRLLCSRGEWNEALPLLERIIGQNIEQQRDSDSLLLLRRIIGTSDELDQKLFPMWIDLCQRTSAIEENWVETERLLVTLQKTLSLDEVLESMRRVSDAAPHFAPARTQHITLLESQGMRSQAALALRDWARFCRDHDDDAQAERHYQHGLDLYADDTELLAEILQFRAECNITTGSADMALHLADLLEADNLVHQAVEALDTGLKLDPQRDDLRRRALALDELIATPENLKRRYNETSAADIGRGDFDSARAILTEGLRRFPLDIDMRHQLVELLNEMGLPDQSIAELASIAEIQAESGDLAAAMQNITRIIEETPENLRAQAIQADIHARMGDEKQALRQFRELSKRLPASPSAWKEQTENDESESAETSDLDILPVMPENTFDHFVVGSRNNFAHATAKAIAQHPGGDYNPLFLHGDVGLGKTHLLQAIALELRKTHPEARVLYTSTEEFTNALIDATMANSIKNFRALYKSPDVLLIDDIHFLGEKERAQEEFFQIYNALYQANRQIVMTSDRPPKEIAHLERRLRSRFSAGIIVDIQSPDLETRMAILRRMAEETGQEVPDNVIERIGERVATNIRELKGALNQILARMQIGQEVPTPEMVDHVLAQVSDEG